MITPRLQVFAIASLRCAVASDEWWAFAWLFLWNQLTKEGLVCSVQASHEISVELETTVGVRSAEELLWGWYWCRYAFKQIWAQARIVVPLCLYVATFKDGVLHGTTGTSLTHARVHAHARAQAQTRGG